jgi:hypothetical protein
MVAFRRRCGACLLMRSTLGLSDSLDSQLRRVQKRMHSVDSARLAVGKKGALPGQRVAFSRFRSTLGRDKAHRVDPKDEPVEHEVSLVTRVEPDNR